MRRKQDQGSLLDPAPSPKFAVPFDPSRWATPKEAALILRRLKRNQDGPSEGAIRNMVYRGQLVAQKFFGRLLFDREYLNRLIAMAPQVGGV